MTPTEPSTLGLLHPGEMGAAVGAQLRSRGHTVLWCSRGRGERSRERAGHADLRETVELGELLQASDVVLSVCPPAAALDVARLVAEAGYRGIYVDANAIAPETMGQVSDVLAQAGASVLDGAIIGPPPGAANTARLYLAGEHTGLVAGLLTGTRLEPVELDAQPGRASALKMAFASFQKASRVLAAVAHSLADEHGVTDALLDEADRMSGRVLAERDYLPSVAERA